MKTSINLLRPKAANSRPIGLQPPDAPTLHITHAAPGFTLQSTDSLSPTNWVTAPSGTNNPATAPATVPARFYRLFKP